MAKGSDGQQNTPVRGWKTEQGQVKDALSILQAKKRHQVCNGTSEFMGTDWIDLKSVYPQYISLWINFR